ncbi:hypothetical protein KEM60_01144 [Austwickia sp. TVS 96-490-7B]|nr:hypothetical protein [Austwickia sp. TVS 96-490-7B]
MAVFFRRFVAVGGPVTPGPPHRPNQLSGRNTFPPDITRPQRPPNQTVRGQELGRGIRQISNDRKKLVIHPILGPPRWAIGGTGAVTWSITTTG